MTKGSYGMIELMYWFEYASPKGDQKKFRSGGAYVWVSP